ncbi:major facilitator superfamily domain-containing protein [Xylaria telfairii]|nr:major facilitator superfamily domain-containing protein [Xylaria telfairii]
MVATSATPITMASTASPNDRHPGADGTRSGSVSGGSTLNEPPLEPTMSYDINLPNRTLSNAANLAEFIIETRDGQIPGPVEPDGQRRYRLVTFHPGDPENPKNWSKAFKWYITMVVATTCFVVAFASSVVTPDIDGVASEFECSREVALLSITLFVVGFGIGPLAFAPLSEVYGRQVIYVSTLAIAVVFIIPCAVAKNIATLLVGRAIDGIAFSAPITIIGGTLADLWKAEERGIPMAAFSAAPFIGPAVGPLIGGFLSDSLGWRWLYWLTLILAGVIWILITFTVPETYAPTILAKRAKKLRKETGEKDWVTEQDLDMRPLGERMRIFLIMPLKLLFGELIVFLISLYMSVLYGLLYMFFIAFPIVFHEGKGYTAGLTGLTFIPLAIGVVASAMCSPFVNKHYVKIIAPYAGRMPPAELRLIPMMFACWFIPLGLIIFAWTSFPRLIWVGPTLAGFPVGFGFIFIYNAANNYLVDTYQDRAASALASKTFIRSLWGAGVVLFTHQLYDRLGYQWASTLLAGISLLCCMIPFLFWKYGERIRRRSKYAYAGDDVADSKGAVLPEKTNTSRV